MSSCKHGPTGPTGKRGPRGFPGPPGLSGPIGPVGPTTPQPTFVLTSSLTSQISDNSYTLPDNSFSVYSLDSVVPASNFYFGRLGSGFPASSTVYAVAVDSKKQAYIGGDFIQVNNELVVNNITVWDPRQELYSNLDGGLNGTVRAIAVDANSGVVYIGGDFTIAYQIQANNLLPVRGIAMWNPITSTFTELVDSIFEGLNGSCFAIDVDPNGLVYVGGNFTLAGSITANNIATYNPSTLTWSALENGLNGACNAIAIHPTSGFVYVGGNFSEADGQPNTNYIGRWDPLASTWSSLSDTIQLDGPCRAIAIGPNGLVYVGGDFTNPGSYFAIFDPLTSDWSSPFVLGNNVYAICVLTSAEIYIGGAFFSHILYNGVELSSAAPFNNTCYALATDSQNIYAGGAFTQGNIRVLNKIAVITRNYLDLKFNDALITTLAGGSSPIQAVATSTSQALLFNTGSS